MEVLDLDCRYIVTKGIFGTQPNGESTRIHDRVRRGVVMGGVQSGKTASMLGVAALSIDQGIDIIVILAGSTKSLWAQTLHRVSDSFDLVGQSDETRSRGRLLVPQISDQEDLKDGSTPRDFYRMNRAHVLRMVREQKPVIAVVMKNVHHVKALAQVLHERVYPILEDMRSSYSVLVLDDEADDGSILDARVEQHLNPAVDDLKQLPRAIVDLWEKRPHHGATVSEKLNVTYVAYTATPYANFLQSDFNPLAPKDFAISLRTPYDIGLVSPRSTTYAEPLGIGNFYIGGETFYRRLRPGILCVPVGQDDRENLRESLRAYLLSAAVSLVCQGRKFTDIIGREFDTRERVLELSPDPRTMLIHTSSNINDHFEIAADLLSACGGISRREAQTRIFNGERSLPIPELLEQLESEEDVWIESLESIFENDLEVKKAFALLDVSGLLQSLTWDQVRLALVTEIIPNVRISIVNSDSSADDRPRFNPSQSLDGMWRSAPDLLTVFVSGNVMSRGLTLEGLTTTLFLRQSNDPLADTQMQMQRWFGYRGRYLELCKVFVSSDQLSLFGKYHEADEALRRSLISAMNENANEAPNVEVLQGLDFSATGKLANLSNWPLSPGPTSFFTLLNANLEGDNNAKVVANVFKNRESSDLIVGETLRGRICNKPLSLSEAADLLDQLQYDEYRPSIEGRHAQRWRVLQSHVGISPDDVDSNLIPFFRPPLTGAISSEVVPNCPYSIAAYLRFWSACLSRHARGVNVVGQPDIPWSIVDLEMKRQLQPTFYVGIRYGSGQVVNTAEVEALPFAIRASVRSTSLNRIEGTWGTQNPGEAQGAYLGDRNFDVHFHGGSASLRGQGNSSWRPEGQPGQILFYFVEDKSGRLRSPVTGVVIPAGGPEQIAAIVL